MPPRTEYSRYGSTVHKQVYIYGGLDRGPTELHRNFGLAWSMSGWLLTPFLGKARPRRGCCGCASASSTSSPPPSPATTPTRSHSPVRSTSTHFAPTHVRPPGRSSSSVRRCDHRRCRGGVLFTGGPIVTFDGTPTTSLAIDGDRIVAIGDAAESWASTFDEVVRLDGRALVPAFRDGHAHPLHAGINRNELDLTGVRPFDAVIERVRQWPRRPSGRPMDRRALLRPDGAAAWSRAGGVARRGVQ